jgi:glycosyltransferase involved in cell wall biosynthesis
MLEKAGFTDIKVYVSEFTKGDPYSSGGLLGRAGTIIAKNLWYYFCQITFVLSLGRLIFSPTMLVFARNAPKGAPKKTRVLQIITRFNRGGSALALFSLVLGLEADKFDVSLMSGRSNELYLEEKDLLVQKGIGYIYIPELVRDIAPLKDIMAFWKMFYFIKNGRFDIVHAHTSKAGFLGRWAAWFSGTKKIVYTPHGHIFYGYFGKIANIFFVYLEKATAFVTDKIVALTERGRQEYLAYKIGPPDKFSFIYSGIDIEKLKDRQIDKDKEKQRLNIPLDRFLIGTVTRYEPVKGNKYLIFAAVQVIRAYPASMFIIVGDGSQRKMLESLVRRSGINENVMFIRHTQDVIPIVSIFDIFVLPSLNEGMGRVLLEAQALGVPVVATGVGGVPCVVKDGQTGIIVPPKDPKALAEAIVKLIQDEEMRKRLAMQAREWIGQDFSSQTMIKKYSELYTQLLAKDKK